VLTFEVIWQASVGWLGSGEVWMNAALHESNCQGGSSCSLCAKCFYGCFFV